MIEEQLKELMKERYGNVKNFARIINMPYSTLDTILKRGLLNSNVQNVITICNKLEIDIEEIRNNKIVRKKMSKKEFAKEVKRLLDFTDLNDKERAMLLNQINMICVKKE